MQIEIIFGTFYSLVKVHNNTVMIIMTPTIMIVFITLPITVMVMAYHDNPDNHDDDYHDYVNHDNHDDDNHQRPSLAATEGQLYRGLVHWAQERQARYPKLHCCHKCPWSS